jgi:hypothetical protein
MRTWMMMVALIASTLVGGCGAPSMFAPPLADAGPDADPAVPDADPAAPDAGVDATPGPDAAVPDDAALIAMCGALPRSLAEWERCYIKRRCEWAVNCQFAGKYATVDECLSWPNLVEGGDVFADQRSRAYAVEAGRARIDTATFAQCLAMTGADRCSTAYLEPTCKLRLSGTVADGEACAADVECRSPGATCARDCAEACCEGTCRPAYAEGEVCDLFESCQPGLQCNFAEGEERTFRCVAGDVGTPCWDQGDCDPGAWCDTEAGECRADFTEGVACTKINQCSGDTECVGLQRRLEPAACRRVSEAGDRCDSICRGNLYCEVPQDRTQWGTCVALAEPNGPCAQSGPFCSAGYACQGGACVPKSKLGASCARVACLPDLLCSSELPPSDGPAPEPVCIRPQAAGARCSHGRQCESYRCSGGVSAPGVCLPGPTECAAAP